MKSYRYIYHGIFFFWHSYVTSGEASCERFRSNNCDILYEHIGSFRGYSNAEIRSAGGVQANIGRARMDNLAFSEQSMVECYRSMSPRFIGHYIDLHGSANHGRYC